MHVVCPLPLESWLLPASQWCVDPGWGRGCPPPRSGVSTRLRSWLATTRARHAFTSSEREGGGSSAGRPRRRSCATMARTPPPLIGCVTEPPSITRPRGLDGGSPLSMLIVIAAASPIATQRVATRALLPRFARSHHRRTRAGDPLQAHRRHRRKPRAGWLRAAAHGITTGEVPSGALDMKVLW